MLRIAPPPLVVAATAVFTLLLCAYSVTVPLLEAPDEYAHVDLVFHLAKGGDYPRFDGQHVGQAPVALFCITAATTLGCADESPTNRLRVHTAANAPAKRMRPTFDALGGESPTIAPNALPQHPPLYYQLMAGALRVERSLTHGHWPMDREVALLRIVNIVLVMWLPLLAWLAARQLGLDDSVAVATALLPLAIPQLLHIGSAVNNDNLLILLGGLFTVLLARVLRSGSGRKNAAALGAVAGLAILTKLFALAFIPSAALAYWLAATPDEHAGTAAGARRSRVVALAAVVGSAAAVSGWWFVDNVVRTHSIAPTIALADSKAPAGFVASPVHFATEFANLFVHRFWGTFGWFSAAIPGVFVLAATLVLAGLVAAGVRRSRELAVMLAPVALMLAFVVQHAWSLYERSSELAFIQGRYVFGGLTGVAVVAGVGARRVFNRWALWFLGGWALSMQVVALGVVGTVYWGASGDGWLGRARAVTAWTPWPGAVVAVGAPATVVATLWLVVEVARQAGRGAASASATNAE